MSEERKNWNVFKLLIHYVVENLDLNLAYLVLCEVVFSYFFLNMRDCKLSGIFISDATNGFASLKFTYKIHFHSKAYFDLWLVDLLAGS